MARKLAKKSAKKSTGPALLSGGNPRIAKAYGEAPVRAYIAAMPGWKRDVGARLDALITRAVPGVRKAVKWNSPFYGIEDGVWFLSFHCFTRTVKVAFFRGAGLRPPPPGPSKQKHVRYLDISEDERLDEQQFSSWVKQASKDSIDRQPTLRACQIETLSKGVNAMAGSKTSAKTAKKAKSPSPSSDWRSEMLSRIRTLIKEADPDAIEEVKWRKPSNPAGVPVWSHAGIICTGERYKTHVKLTFASGAALADPAGLFNSSLEGAMRRGIDIHEGDKINEKALKALIRSAAALNAAKQKKARPLPSKKKAKRASS